MFNKSKDIQNTEDILAAENEQKAHLVKHLFTDIAPSYDLANHFLSLNIDKFWRRFVVNKLRDILMKPNVKALDVCCGTADLALELGKFTETIGIDFCQEMLLRGLKKVHQRNLPVMLCAGDALNLPFVDKQFDVVTIAFGLRNLVDFEKGLSEIYRLLKSGGRAAILEFSHPIIPGFSHLFNFYFNHILPVVGGLISGSLSAYKYLPNSVKDFPNQKILAEMMRRTGFIDVTYYNLSGGIAALHLGTKL